MEPEIGFGVFSQRQWPGAGDVDDCWALADFMAVHATAPWLHLPNIPVYRTAAANPDQPGPTGGRIGHSARAIRELWPKLGFDRIDNVAGAPARTLEMVRSGRAATVSIVSGSLPPDLRYGFMGLHRVAVVFKGGFRIGNGLAQPHSRWDQIDADRLKGAMQAWPPGAGDLALVFETPASAIRDHPDLTAILNALRTETLTQARNRLIDFVSSL